VLVRVAATVLDIIAQSSDLVELRTEFGPAIAYPAIVGRVAVGDELVINRTATTLGLGTGGYDFVMGVVTRRELTPSGENTGHIVKLRYTPSQIAVTVLEEREELGELWEKDLAGFPVVVCELHSQIAHVAAAVAAKGKIAVYVMTDAGSLMAPFSKLLGELRAARLITASITTGQSYGGDYETVTVHSALLAAKYFLGADVAIVAQGPGNAGTATHYGFGGIAQATGLDTVAALGGEPIAVVRVSSKDARPRHQGISHHTLTVLKLVRSNCTIPVPAGMICEGFEQRHNVVQVSNLQESFDLLARHKIRVTTMGRDENEDRIFFDAASVAGKYASELGEPK
jgi:ribosomal protein L3